MMIIIIQLRPRVL